jgi:hypothetical protein
MTRNVIVLALSVTAALVIGNAVRAAPSAAVCRAFKQGSKTFDSETLGNGWTCASAERWIVKLSKDPIKASTKNIVLTNGPKGYHCYAEPTSKGGHATDGTCITGTIAFPGKGFAWFEA